MLVDRIFPYSSMIQSIVCAFFLLAFFPFLVESSPSESKMDCVPEESLLCFAFLPQLEVKFQAFSLSSTYQDPRLAG